MRSRPWRTLALATALACALGCGEEVPDPLDEARATLAEAPEPVREEVLRTCDKWKPGHGGACDPEAVERDQLICWLEQGLPHLKAALRRGQRQRARNHRVLLHQNFCMERRGWRFRKPGGGSLKDVE